MSSSVELNKVSKVKPRVVSTAVFRSARSSWNVSELQSSLPALALAALSKMTIRRRIFMTLAGQAGFGSTAEKKIHRN